jgi:hypothetical protein
MHQVLELTSQALMGHLFRRQVSKKNLCNWMEEVCRPLLRYILEFHILVKRWLTFIFKFKEDTMKIMGKQRLWGCTPVTLKHWTHALIHIQNNALSSPFG